MSTKHLKRLMSFAILLVVFCGMTGVRGQTSGSRSVPPEAFDLPLVGQTIKNAMPYATDHFLVKFTAQAVDSKSFGVETHGAGTWKTGLETVDGLNRVNGITRGRRLHKYVKNKILDRQCGVSRWYILEAPYDMDVEQVIRLYQKNPHVEIAIPDYKFYPSGVVTAYRHHESGTPLNWANCNVGQTRMFDWGEFDTATRIFTPFPGGTVPFSPLDERLGSVPSTQYEEGLPGFDCMGDIAWGYTLGSPDIIIAILDSGVDMGHPDLAGSIWTNPGEWANGWDDDLDFKVDDIYGWDFGDVDNDPSPVPWDSGVPPWHGTCCASIAAGQTNTMYGTSGIARGCCIMPLRIYPTGVDGEDVLPAFWSNIVDAVLYATNKGARVISMSFGHYSLDTQYLNAMEAMLSYAWQQDVIMFASTGNDSRTDAIKFPASSGAVFAVGAVRRNGNRAAFSNYNGGAEADEADAVDFVGPTGIFTATAGDTDEIKYYYSEDGTAVNGADLFSYAYDGYAFFDGTSCACPYVAGVAALILSQDPSMTRNDVIQRMKDTATDVVNSECGEGWDVYTGYGLVNAGAAVCNNSDFIVPGHAYSGSGTFSAANTLITSYNCRIKSGANVTFQAGTSVTLRPGFWAQAGCTFTAKRQ